MDKRIRKIDLENKQELKDAKEYLDMVKEELKETFKMSEDEITKKMTSADFKRIFYEDPYFFFHYEPYTAAETIYNSK